MADIINLSQFQNNKQDPDEESLIKDPDYDMGASWMALDFRTQLQLLRNLQLNLMHSKFTEQARRAISVGDLLSIAEVLLGEVHPLFGFQKVTVLQSELTTVDTTLTLAQYDTTEATQSSQTGIFPAPIYEMQISFVDFEEPMPKSKGFNVAKLSYIKPDNYHNRMAGVIKSLLISINNFAFINEGFCVVSKENGVFVAYVQQSEKRAVQIAFNTKPGLVYNED